VECYLCERDAAHECARCGALYCDDHGEAQCERCGDPDLALPSHRLYRGSLLALFAGSLFALWLLIRPPGGDEFATTPITPVVGPATIVLAPDPTPTSTATEQPATSTATPTPTAATETTPTPSPTATPSPTPSPTASPTPTPSPSPTPTPSPSPTPTPSPSPTLTTGPYIEHTVESGDHLSAIVARYVPDDADWEEFQARIIELNDIENPASLDIGQVLQIPRE